jgi:hypothetical protein
VDSMTTMTPFGSATTPALGALIGVPVECVHSAPERRLAGVYAPKTGAVRLQPVNVRPVTVDPTRPVAVTFRGDVWPAAWRPPV